MFSHRISSFPCRKCWTRVEVGDSDKRTSLLQRCNKHLGEKLCNTWPFFYNESSLRCVYICGSLAPKTQRRRSNYFADSLVVAIKQQTVWSRSTKANGREPKTCLGRVFNYKLDCFEDVYKTHVCGCTSMSVVENSAQVSSCAKVCPWFYYNIYLARNTKGGSITAPLTSCLTGLESAVWLLTIWYSLLLCLPPQRRLLVVFSSSSNW